MSAGAKLRLRKMVIVLVSALAMLGWASAAGADQLPGLPERVNTGEPRRAGGEPEDLPPASAPDEDRDSPDAEQLLAKLPKTWNNPDLLAQASIEINSLLTQAERHHKLVPWELADGFRRSLLAGQAVALQIHAETRVAYYQSLFMSALAAGWPDEAAWAAGELIKLDNQQGWNWLAVYRSGMLRGDKAACLQAIERISRMVGPGGAEALDPMKWQCEPIGDAPSFTVQLSDGSAFSPANARNRVVVFDFWAFQEKTYVRAFPLVRRVYQTFRGYPAFSMIGVNMDNREFRNVVNQFMRANAMVWPQYFEGQGDRPISFKVFRSRLMPSQAVLGPSGKVIFLGQPNDPMLYYAIRTGLVQAAGGRIPASQPDDLGPAHVPTMPAKEPKPPDQPVVNAAEEKAEREKAAAQQLRVGQAFESNGFKSKAIEVYRGILQKYPDTDAAMKAQARLLRLER